jgi:hypothetical protein
MEDFLLAGLVLVFFIVFLFRAQSFASSLSPASANCFGNSLGFVNFIDDPSGNNNALCKTLTGGNYPNSQTAGNGKHYCCQ